MSGHCGQIEEEPWNEGVWGGQSRRASWRRREEKAQLWSGGQLAAKEGDRMWDGGAHCREDEASRPWLGFWAWSPKPSAGELEEEYITAVVRGPEGDL